MKETTVPDVTNLMRAQELLRSSKRSDGMRVAAVATALDRAESRGFKASAAVDKDKRERAMDGLLKTNAELQARVAELEARRGRDTDDLVSRAAVRAMLDKLSRAGGSLIEWTKAIASLDALPSASVAREPSARELPEVGGDSLPMSLNEFEHRCKVCIAEEQAKLLPENHLIAVLCDAVLLCRENGRRGLDRITAEPSARERLAPMDQLVLWKNDAPGRGYSVLPSGDGFRVSLSCHPDGRQWVGICGTEDAAILAALAVATKEPTK